MRTMSDTVQQAIAAANVILPGVPAPDGDEDPRWQALMRIAEHIEGEPDAVWTFVANWGCHEDDDLRMGVATCLLEHLLEHHFRAIFPLVETLCGRSERFADTFRHCWKFGETKVPVNEDQFDALKRRVGQR